MLKIAFRWPEIQRALGKRDPRPTVMYLLFWIRFLGASILSFLAALLIWIHMSDCHCGKLQPNFLWWFPEDEPIKLSGGFTCNCYQYRVATICQGFKNVWRWSELDLRELVGFILSESYLTFSFGGGRGTSPRMLLSFATCTYSARFQDVRHNNLHVQN